MMFDRFSTQIDVFLSLMKNAKNAIYALKNDRSEVTLTF